MKGRVVEVQIFRKDVEEEEVNFTLKTGWPIQYEGVVQRDPDAPKIITILLLITINTCSMKSVA